MNNINNFKKALFLILLTATLINLNGQSKRFYINPNFTHIHLAEKSKVNLVDTNLENTFSLTDSKTLGVSLGYNFSSNLSIDIVVGIPPSLDIIGKNEFEGIAIGSIVYSEHSTHIKFPQPLNFVLHNIMEHTAHHGNIQIPLYELSNAQNALESEFKDRIQIINWNLKFYWNSIKTCKLYDYDNHTWLDFKTANT